MPQLFKIDHYKSQFSTYHPVSKWYTGFLLTSPIEFYPKLKFVPNVWNYHSLTQQVWSTMGCTEIQQQVYPFLSPSLSLNPSSHLQLVPFGLFCLIFLSSEKGSYAVDPDDLNSIHCVDEGVLECGTPPVSGS